MSRTIGMLATILAATAPCACAASPPSVRDRIVRAVQARLPGAAITTTDANGFVLKQAGRDENAVSTQRITDFCAVNPRVDCDDQIATFAAGVVALQQTDFTVTPQRLRVIVRNRLDTEGYVASLPDPAKRPLVRPFIDTVAMVLAADDPQGTRMVDAEDLAVLKLDADAAFALGTQQVLADLPGLPKLSDIDGKLVSLQGFDYGASVLLRPERWAALAGASGGRLFVAVPGDNDVLIGTTKLGEDPAKLKQLVAEEYRLAPRSISPVAYRWSAAGWVALPLP